MVFKFSIDTDETLLEHVADVMIWVFFCFGILVTFRVFTVVILLHDCRKCYLYKVTYFTTKLSMAVTYTKHMQRWKATHIRGKYILVLIHLVGVMWMKAYSSSKCELAHTVFAFLVC